MMAIPRTHRGRRLTRAAQPRPRTGATLALIAAGLVGLVVLAGSGPARAGEPRRIELPEGIEIALQQNTTLRRAENASILDHTAVSQATMAFTPDLRLSASGGRSYAWSSVAGEQASVSNGSVRAGLASGLVLFDGLANFADLSRARLDEDAGLLELERARQTVVFQVMTGWLAMIAAQEQVGVREENLSAQEEQERQVRALVEGGSRPISDLYQQQAAVASARLTLVETRRTYELACIDLVQQLLLDPTGEYVFVVPPLPDSTGEESELDQVALLDQALAQRADLNATEMREQAAGQQERSAKGGRWPSVSLSASYGASYSDSGPGDLMEQFWDRQSGSVGLSLSLPVFDRLATSSAIEQARVGQANARLTLADLRQEVGLQVRRAVLDVNTARETLRAADARMRAAQQALEANQERYAAGAATLIEVTLTRADWVGAVSDRVRARYTLLWQERLLDYYVGNLDLSGRLS
jgi:outer membrane protein